MMLESSTWVTAQAEVPPVGLLEAMTLPAAPTATQKPLVGQDTLEKHGDDPLTAAPQSEPRTWVTIHADTGAALGDGIGIADGGVVGAVGVTDIGVGAEVGDATPTPVGVAPAWIEARA
jgi:hypothetical protein